LKQVRKACYK